MASKLRKKYIILGAGVTGITTAYFLNKAGYDVTVIDKNEKAATECSYANGGQLSYTTEPWCSPATLKILPKWLLQKNSPLTMPAIKDLAAWKWAFGFLLNSKQQTFNHALASTIKLSYYSKNVMQNLLAKENIQFNHSKDGILHVFYSHKEFDEYLPNLEIMKQNGAIYQILQDHKSCVSKDPALQYMKAHLVGGVFFPSDEMGNVSLFCSSLKDICQKNGVKFFFNTEVKKIVTNQNKIEKIITNGKEVPTDLLVICLGANSNIFLSSLGLKTPFYPLKGYSVSIKANEYAPKIGLNDHNNRLVYSRLDDVVRIAGFAEFKGFDSQIDNHKIQLILDKVKLVFPKLDYESAENTWSCLRPATNDCLPIIGATNIDNLYVNTGHGSLGWTFACGSAKLITDIIQNQKTDIDSRAFAINRFQ